MAKPLSLLPLSLTLLALLLHGCLARQREQVGGGQFQNECQLDRLDGLEPSERIDSEAGHIEWWDHNNPQLRCAGVSIVRRVIQPNGLYLPTFHSAPQISYVVQGRGFAGRVVPGCAETFMDSQGERSSRERQKRSREGQEQGEWGERGRQFRDAHQKVEDIRRGDVLTWPQGTAHWLFNHGNEPLVVISLIDIANEQNQLDRNPRAFRLAGSYEQGSGRRFSREKQGSQQQRKNLFFGFDVRNIADSFNVAERLAEQVKNRRDKRGNIVDVKGGFGIISPSTRRERGQSEEEREREREREREGERPYSPSEESESEEERERRREERESERESPRRRGNGIEETFCSMRFRENVDDPSKADVYKPQLGRISNLNSLKLPILRYLRLSATRGSIHGNALVLPKWNANANEALYVTEGEARVQVVNDNGQSVFDGNLRRGQLLIIPQGFAYVKRAQGGRFEWISFKTNDNAYVNSLAGRTSVMRGLPLEVIANGFQISNEEARNIKYNTQETTLTEARGGREISERPEA